MKTANTPPALQAAPQELIERAAGLRGLIRQNAAAAEQLGHYPPEVHEAFLAAGFYHLLTPRRYGGLEVDLRTYARLIMEVGRGDPGIAWCLSLGQGHALTTAARWSERAQQEVFGDSRGYFRASHSVNPAGTATRVDGGWLVNAKSRYQSGVPYATHATVSVQVVGDEAPDLPGPPPGGPGAPGADRPGVPGGPGFDPARLLQVLIPAGQFTVLDDWGGEAVFGMRASGSNTIVVDDQVVPEHYGTFLNLDSDPDKSPGVRLHGNPIYLNGPPSGFAGLELAPIIVGAARAALDEYETLARLRPAAMSRGARYQDPFYQRDFGAATIKANCAEAIVLQVADTYTRWCRDAVNGVRPFTSEMDDSLAGMLMQAGELAGDAVYLLFRSAGTSASAQGQPMQRYLRDVSMYRTHHAVQPDPGARRYGAVLLGDVPAIPGPPPSPIPGGRG